MDERRLYTLRILLTLIVVSESAVIIPRGLSKEGPSGEGEIPLAVDTFGTDKKLGLSPGTWDPEVGGDDFGTYDFDMGVNDPNGQPTDYDYMKPAEGDNSNEIVNSKPETKPEKIPTDVDREMPEKEHDETDDETDVNKDKEDEPDKSEDDGFYEPFDSEEDLDKSTGDGKDSKLPSDEDEEKSIPKDVDESHHSEDDDEKVSEDDEKVSEDDDEKVSEDDDEKVSKDDEKVSEEDTDEESDENDVPDRDYEDKGDKDEEDDKDIPISDDEESDDEHDKDGEDIGGGEEAEHLGVGSIFETPFFNLHQVRKYFSQLERALGHVFRETLDEALLLNGTYANTTEEEVDIDGKKYIVHKSIIKGGDNQSSIYVEALSSKEKLDDADGTENFEVKNVTR